METPLAHWVCHQAGMVQAYDMNQNPACYTRNAAQLETLDEPRANCRPSFPLPLCFIAFRVLVLVTLRLGFSTQRLKGGLSFEALITRSRYPRYAFRRLSRPLLSSCRSSWRFDQICCTENRTSRCLSRFKQNRFIATISRPLATWSPLNPRVNSYQSIKAEQRVSMI